MDQKEALAKIAEELAVVKAALERAAGYAKEAGVSFSVPAPGSHFFVAVPVDVRARFKELKGKEGRSKTYYSPAQESTLTEEEDKELGELYDKFDHEYYRPYQLTEGGESYAYEYDGWWANSNC